MPPFRHDALLYADDDAYLAGTVPFIEAGLAAGEPVLVAVPAARLDRLRAALGPGETPLLRLAPMDELGRNPAWIIPAWADFVAPHVAAGRPARGIGEPIWKGRSPDEIVECCWHEALLNLAFADAADFQLLCPYDVGGLDDAVLHEAHRNHPHVRAGGATVASGCYSGSPRWPDGPLPPAPAGATSRRFDTDALTVLRALGAAVAAEAGLDPTRANDLVVALSEAITNSVQHGGGGGRLTIWSDRTQVVCEVEDGGHITDPLAGRRRPGPGQVGGRGLWLIHQLCDLVQIRAVPGGQVLRLHVSA